MNIALVTLNFWPIIGGMESAVHDLATSLHDLGHRVTVFAPSLRDHQPEVDHRYALVRFGWTASGAYRLGLNKYVLRWAVRRRHRAQPFDVINAHSAHLATSYALQAARPLGVPVVITTHGADIQSHAALSYGVRLNPKDDKRVRGNLARSALAIGSSRSTCRELRELLPAGKVIDIPLGVDMVPAIDGYGPWVRRVTGVQHGRIIIAVGRNARIKLFRDAVRAFGDVATEIPDVHFVHIGRGGKALQVDAKARGVGDRFHALGEVPRHQVLAAYREADLFVSASAMEAFGIVTFEAMAAGLPCLVSDGPGNRDAVEAGVTGLVVPVGDTRAMGTAMVALMRARDARRRLGAAGRLNAMRFAWHIVAAEYAAAFEAVVRDRKGA